MGTVQTKNKTQRKRAGFGLIELLMATALLASVVVGTWTVFIYLNTQVLVARVKTVAANLAGERMEIIRNMAFEDLGTTTGHPHGDIPATQIMTINKVPYTVATTIRYYDDVADGLVGGVTVGKHVQYWPTDCHWTMNNIDTITIDFYNDGVVQDLDFDDYAHGNQFNWSGKITVDGEDQHFHLHTADVNSCLKLSVQTQNVEKPFKLYIDGVLVSTYTAPDTFTQAAGFSYVIVGSGGVVPGDLYPNDYLQVEVAVSWSKVPCPTPVKFTTFVAQRGQETASATGILAVEVIDASGNPVPNARITLNNPGLGMSEIQEISDINGLRMIPVLEPADQTYEVVVSKDSYSTEQTYMQTVQNPYPQPEHLTVVAGSITESTFIIDLLSELNLTVVKLDDTPASNVGMTLTGTKVISRQAPWNLKFPETSYQTDGSGLLTIEDLEFDTYTLVVELPSGDVSQTLALSPNTVMDWYISPHTYEVIVKDTSTSAVLPDAMVTLTKADVGFDQELTTSTLGVALFESLHSGVHQREVVLNGYTTVTGDITVNQGSNQEIVWLVPV